ncbi:acyl-CoA synthetase (AMP-forming)/AMP-acid ligase II [Geodermatophilus tzadiensis]|uniref:Acyl-CoA synthetase (AMP-forming)/AMP-acid ligase II n=1 Tax=Geodermatophilus tzadiensis TaxID=1137988 RepID=A0A2T0TRL6_9ACTN|nr:alpha/beta fold hydrolase [Geodermatophilus tzadiensis]PRY48158.1 acyl-CoA synthetase (AMP-forming)/AMP-acid ligase II [Geodermatophilus tzadiensis]
MSAPASGPPVAGPARRAGAVASVFEAVVAQRGGATAVSGPDSCLSFEELGARARAAAGRIAALVPPEAAPGAPVAVLATPAPELVVAVFGVVLTGRPLVVLDPQLPTGRLQQIQEMAGAAIAVVEGRLAARAEEVGTFPVVTDLDALVAPPGPEDVAPADGSGEPPAAPGPDSPATIVFTSGSTGRPKGVVHGQAFVVAEAAITARYMDLTAEDRVGLVLPPSFALGEHALFGALLNGVGLHVYDPRDRGMRGLPAFLREQGVTVLTMTPSLLRALTGVLSPGQRLDDLRLVATAGEALQGRDVRAARDRLGEVTIMNHLGSSETGQLSFAPLLPADPVGDGPVPAGYVAEEKEIQVLGEDGRAVPPGEVGTLHVLGTHLASYLTGSADGPFGRAEDGRATFRTGDRGRYDEHGVLHQLGRTDDAVKVNGYLVEPSEVETALRGLTGVADAAVVAVRHDTGTGLVGYVAPSSDQRTPSPAQLRRELVALLPSWMVPAELVLLDELPRNERGKVDRGALPPPVRPEPEPPQGHWEQVVAGLFESVLHRSGVGRDETFTSLGGDSLSVEEMLTRLGEEHGVVLTSGDVAENATVRQLAAVVARSRAGDAGGARVRSGRRRASVVALRQSGSRLPVLCFAGAGAGGQAFLPLAEVLGDDQPVYAFQPHGFEEWGLPDYSIGMAARRHLRRLRAIQPHGPYRLVGHSMGGLVALQVARRLAAAGERVDSVTLVDTVLPQRLVERAWPAEATAAGERPTVAPLPGDDKYGPPTTRRELWRRRVLALATAVLPPGGARMEGMLELGVRVSLLHHPQPWDGRVDVYVSHLNEASLVVWEQLLVGDVRMTTLPGEHNSLLRTPYVEQIARGLATDGDTAP